MGQRGTGTGKGLPGVLDLDQGQDRGDGEWQMPTAGAGYRMGSGEGLPGLDLDGADKSQNGSR